MGRFIVSILNMEVREGFPEEVMFERDQKKVKEQAIQLSDVQKQQQRPVCAHN